MKDIDPQLKRMVRGGLVRKLKEAVEEDTFARIMGDISQSLRKCEERCASLEKNAVEGDNTDTKIEEEIRYTDDFIGMALLALQSKIRRVAQAAIKLRDFETKADIRDKPSKPICVKDILTLAPAGPYKSGLTYIEAIWQAANYFKHRDEWDYKVWARQTENKQVLITLDAIIKMDIGKFSTEQYKKRELTIYRVPTFEMRRIFAFLEISPYSNTDKLVDTVQAWAKTVFDEYRDLPATEGGKRKDGHGP